LNALGFVLIEEPDFIVMTIAGSLVMTIGFLCLVYACFLHVIVMTLHRVVGKLLERDVVAGSSLVGVGTPLGGKVCWDKIFCAVDGFWHCSSGMQSGAGATCSTDHCGAASTCHVSMFWTMRHQTACGIVQAID